MYGTDINTHKYGKYMTPLRKLNLINKIVHAIFFYVLPCNTIY